MLRLVGCFTPGANAPAEVHRIDRPPTWEVRWPVRARTSGTRADPDVHSRVFADNSIAMKRQEPSGLCIERPCPRGPRRGRGAQRPWRSRVCVTPSSQRSRAPATTARAAPGRTEPWPACLRGEIGAGFSLVLSQGGSVAGLASCAGGLDVSALYTPRDGVYVSRVAGAPAFASAQFVALFTNGVPTATALPAKSGSHRHVAMAQRRTEVVLHPTCDWPGARE